MKLLIATVALVACNSGAARSSEKVAGLCKLDRDKQSITVTGYLSVPIMIGDCTKRCTVNVADTRDYTHQTLAVSLRIGSEPLTLSPLPPVTTNLQQVGAASFIVNDSDGKQRRIGDRVRITGTLRASMVKSRDYGMGGDGKEVELLQCWLEPSTIRMP